MSTTSAVSSSTSAGPTQSTDSASAFRNADFLKIMMAEVTNQSPLDPQDTSKLVDNMQKLQELANTTYTKFRDDLRWAQDLMGQSISVSQQPLTPKEKEKLVNQGLNPDVGYQQAAGAVSSFRVVNQTVYVQVNGKDYPVDSIRQVLPKAHDESYLAQVANQLIGRQVVYNGADGKPASGLVRSVQWDKDNQLRLEVGDKAVSFGDILQIGG